MASTPLAPDGGGGGGSIRLPSSSSVSSDAEAGGRPGAAAPAALAAAGQAGNCQTNDAGSYARAGSGNYYYSPGGSGDPSDGVGRPPARSSPQSPAQFSAQFPGGEGNNSGETGNGEGRKGEKRKRNSRLSTPLSPSKRRHHNVQSSAASKSPALPPTDGRHNAGSAASTSAAPSETPCVSAGSAASPYPPLLLEPHSLDRTVGKASKVLDSTTAHFAKNGRGAINSDDEQILSVVTKESQRFVRVAHPRVREKLCTADGKFPLRAMAGPESKETGQYRRECLSGRLESQSKSGCTNSTSNMLVGRTRDQVKRELKEKLGREPTREEIELAISETCFIYLTMKESLDFVRADSELEECALAILEAAPGFQSHPDHHEEMFHEVVNFLFELLWISMFEGPPIWAMEKALNLGTQQIRDMLEQPYHEANSDAIAMMTGIKLAKKLFTWTYFRSCIYKHIAENAERMSAATKSATDVMIVPAPPNRFSQNELCHRKFSGSGVLEEPFTDCVQNCALWEAAKDTANSIGDALGRRTAVGAKQRAIQKSIGSFVSSNYTVLYVAPSSGVYTAGAIAGFEKVVSEADAATEDTVLISMEYETKKLLDETPLSDVYFREESAIPIIRSDGKAAGKLWRVDHCDVPPGKRIIILVTSSAHVIVGHLKTLDARIGNCHDHLTIMSVLEAAGVIESGATEVERKIMRATFLDFEGYGDALDSSGDFCNNGRKIAMPKGFERMCNPIKPGVRALTNAITARQLSVKAREVFDHLLVALMALLGYDRFKQMLSIGYGIKVGDDFEAFVEQLATRTITEIRSKPEEERTEEECNWLAAADRKNEEQNAQNAKKRDEYKRIDAKPEGNRSKEEQRTHDAYKAEVDRQNERARERYAKERAELKRIDAKPEEDRLEEEQKTLDEYEAKAEKGNERRRERYAALDEDAKKEKVRKARERFAALDEDAKEEKRRKGRERRAEDSKLIERMDAEDDTMEPDELKRAAKTKAARKGYRETERLKKAAERAKKAAKKKTRRKAANKARRQERVWTLEEDEAIGSVQAQHGNNWHGAYEAKSRAQKNEREREQRRRTSEGTQKMRGVCPTASGKWDATIQNAGKKCHLGTFATQKEASLAYEVELAKVTREKAAAAAQKEEVAKAPAKAPATCIDPKCIRRPAAEKGGYCASCYADRVQKKIFVPVTKPSKDAALGLAITQITQENGTDRVRVDDIKPGSLFARTKLKEGMFLEAVNGKPVRGVEHCVEMLKGGEGLMMIRVLVLA
ncbi:hypothetical protein ACHAXT_000010 [Thalassiosira profunda]